MWVLDVRYCPADECNDEHIHLTMDNAKLQTRLKPILIMSIDEWADLRAIFVKRLDLFEIRENESPGWIGDDINSEKYLDIKRRIDGKVQGINGPDAAE